MRKIISLILCLTMLLTLFCIVPVAETASDDSIYPTPTEYIEGPDIFKGEQTTTIVHKAYVSKETVSAGKYDKSLVADFDISFTSFGDWASVYLLLDSAYSNPNSGFSFQISGPSSFKGNAANYVENPSGCGVVLRKSGEIIDAVPLNVTTVGIISTDYRIILKRVIGDTETSVEFYMFPKGTAIPISPMFSFTYTNEEYGSPSTSVAFTTWEISKFIISNMKLYDYDVAIQRGVCSIDDPDLVPIKTVAGPVTAEGVASTTVYFDAYVSEEEAASTYNKTLVADFNYKAESFGVWTSTILWLDSLGFNDYGGFSFRIAGKNTFGNRDESVDNAESVGVILRRSLGSGKGFEELDFASLNKNNSEFINTEYRIILKRVIGETETTFDFYMFDATQEIPAEPMFSCTYTNEEYGSASKSVGFTTWENPKFTLSNLKLYNYDINIEPYVPSVDAPTLVATKTVQGPETFTGTASKEILHTSYVSKDEVSLGTYNESLVADFNISFSGYGTWKATTMFLDSWDSNAWGGFSFMVAGSTSFANKVGDFIENPSGVGVILRRGISGTHTIIGAAQLGVTEGELAGKEYRIILKRIIGDTDTNVEFYMFESDNSIPAEPMFKFSYTNEEYGSPSTSISFNTWENPSFTISNLKLYNQDVKIEPYVPYIGNEIIPPTEPETPEEDNSVVIERTSTSSERWFDTKAAPADYDYSMAIIGDTQYINRYNPEAFPAIYDWILDNVDAKKIKFVAGLGDITDASTEAEYTLAQEQISRMDGIVPYSIVRGNHDTKKTFNTYFPYENYADTLGGSFDGTMLNTYQELVIGQVKYLIVCLDYGPDDPELEWANEVIAAHPNHNVIVTTHGYLNADGTKIVDGLSVSNGYNDGDDIWDKLIKKHSNITMVLCGHVDPEDIVAVKTPGENGNVVTQMLIDPQRLDHPNSTEKPTGMVCMLYFSDGGSKIEIEYYSTVKKQYFKDINQFATDIEVVAGAAVGDTNGDGDINAMDLTVLKKVLLGIERDYNKTVVDLSANGTTDIIDLIKLKKAVAAYKE